MLRSAASSFQRVTQAIEDFSWRSEVQAEQIPAPLRIASQAYALEACVVTDEDQEIGNGRFILLYEPLGNSAWNGTYRCVSFARADVDLEMVTDPMLADVGWTWLTESLDYHAARYHDASGTVTAVSSRSFGEMASKSDRAEIEIRASWTVESDDTPDISPHIAAWQHLLCTTAGIAPLPDGIRPLMNKLARQ